jgi:hypothetical protein
MTGTDWGGEQAANDANSESTPSDQLSGAQQPETLAFGPEAGTQRQPRSGRRVVAAVSSVAAVVVVAVVVIVVSVGSGQTPAQAVASAVRHSAGYSTLSASIHETVSGANSAAINGKVSVQRTPLLMSMSMSENISGEGIPIAAVLTDKAMYLKLGVSIGLPAADSGKWIELQFARLGALSTFSSLLRSLENENPMSQTQALIAAKDVRDVGTQAVGGTQATKYTGSFAPSAAIKLLPASQRSVLSPALKAITGKVTFSIWISGGRIMQVALVEHVLSSKVTVSIRYLSYNQPLHLTIPSGGDVYVPPASMLSGT